MAQKKWKEDESKFSKDKGERLHNADADVFKKNKQNDASIAHGLRGRRACYMVQQCSKLSRAN